MSDQSRFMLVASPLMENSPAFDRAAALAKVDYLEGLATAGMVNEQARGTNEASRRLAGMARGFSNPLTCFSRNAHICERKLSSQKDLTPKREPAPKRAFLFFPHPRLRFPLARTAPSHARPRLAIN
jgi:hypothetical protein